MKTTLLLVAILSLILLIPGLASACPGCQQGVENEAAGLAGTSNAFGNPALGYNLSVLFMMSMPFLLAGGFTFAFWRAVRKNNESL
jgi:hypothetical protein